MVSEDYGKGWPVRQVSCGQCEKNFRHVKRVKASYGNRERLRSRVISAVKWVRSSSLIAINFKPRRSGRTFQLKDKDLPHLGRAREKGHRASCNSKIPTSPEARRPAR